MQRIISLLLLQFFISTLSNSQDLPMPVDSFNNVKLIVANLQNNSYHTDWECSEIYTNPWHHKNIWNAYNTLEALIEYSLESGDSAYISAIKTFADNKCAFDDAKYAGYDDAQWTGIALLKAYSLTNHKPYLSRSIEMWNYIIENSWDEQECEGGLWWDIDKTYKNAITNELFIVYSTMLYFRTNENKYKDWALTAWDWFEKTGMISLENNNRHIMHLVNDGLDRKCMNNSGAIWTYNQGVIIGGLVNLWLIFEDTYYLDTAINIANSTINNLTIDGILVEKTRSGIVAENINTDQQQFKGIFVRYLSKLIEVLPDTNPNKNNYINFIKKNCNNVLKLYTDFNIGKLWNKNNCEDNFNAISQTAGLDLFTTLLKIRN